MSIVKWSNVRLKTKDKKIITDCFNEIGFGFYRNDHMFI